MTTDPNDTTPTPTLLAWPAKTPLAVLAHHPRWTVLARPRDVRIWRPGDPLTDLWSTLDRAAAEPVAPLSPSPDDPGDDLPPFRGGLLAWLSYDLGRAIEPAAQGPRAPDADRDWPLAVVQQCPDAYAFDHERHRWWTIGDASRLPPLGTPGHPTLSRSWTTPDTRPDPGLARASFEHDVGRVLGYIRAGDVYQVNLAHRLSIPFEGSARALFDALVARARPRHGVYLECDDRATRRAILSASPELFLEVRPGERVRTSPMKGTRPAGADPAELESSEKDRPSSP